ncbi:HNH endonuclease [Zobellia sp.]|nr:HNH endonuclease [Zobellia sp.]
MSFRRHRKGDLLNKITTALIDDGWNVLYLHDTSYHPFIFRIYKGDEKYDIKIYVWNLTHGGGSARPEDEYRIQITGVDQFLLQEDGKVLILGWWEEGGVFAGFDFNFHVNPLGHSPSIQIREEALRNGYINGFSTWKRDNDEIAIAIRPDFLGEYIRNLEGLHAFGASNVDLAALEEVVQAPDEVNDAVIETITLERRSVVQTVTKKLRDNSFKNRVLTAYSNQCSFCGVQLKLIDAAHIVPVEHNGTDQTSNGIALCAMHHRAYDRKLIGFNEEYQIMVHDDNMNNLALLGLDGGRNRFQNDLRAVLHLPPAINDRPHIDFITTANELRGWN